MTSNSTPDKVAVVTGASSGIGAATARALAADGYRVALLARRLDRITALADELGNGSIAIEADVTDRDSIVGAADRVRQELGTANALINNAGVMLLGPFDSGQRADYRQMIEVNLLGAITTTEVFLDQLKDGGGDIINISSVAGRTARSGNGVYAATKWGINGWSESLRQELLPDIRVTLIEPGVVATELPNRITTLADELGHGATAIEADVTDRDSIVAAADRVRQELGTADALINNAGVMLLGPFDSAQRADYRQMIEVNLLGAITATEVFLDQLKDGGGDIINISSVAGRTARSGNGVYAATKWGINGWSESLRQELLPDVRVTLVEPGVVATELPSHITHPDTKQGVQQLYDKAEVTAEDVAEIIAFILSRPRRLAINEILLRPAGQQ